MNEPSDPSREQRQARRKLSPASVTQFALGSAVCVSLERLQLQQMVMGFSHDAAAAISGLAHDAHIVDGKPAFADRSESVATR
jgi:hypothetical protein